METHEYIESNNPFAGQRAADGDDSNADQGRPSASEGDGGATEDDNEDDYALSNAGSIAGLLARAQEDV